MKWLLLIPFALLASANEPSTAYWEQMDAMGKACKALESVFTRGRLEITEIDSRTVVYCSFAPPTAPEIPQPVVPDIDEGSWLMLDDTCSLKESPMFFSALRYKDKLYCDRTMAEEARACHAKTAPILNSMPIGSSCRCVTPGNEVSCIRGRGTPVYVRPHR